MMTLILDFYVWRSVSMCEGGEVYKMGMDGYTVRLKICKWLAV